MKASLKLGTAKIDITPIQSIQLAGFSHRVGVFEGVSHPLYLRVLFFQHEDSQGNKTAALIVSADLIWWGTDRVQLLKRQLQEKWGLKIESVLLHATHNHSGPQTSNLFTSLLGKFDLNYIGFLESQLFEGIALAMNSMEPVSIERGSGDCKIGIHRRKKENGQIRMAPNPDGPNDSEVTVIRFRTEAGNTKGLLVHFTCHPTTTGDNWVSAEFPGVSMDQVEQTHDGSPVSAYLQGCCGDLRPSLIHEEDFYRGNDQDVQRLGSTLADEVLAILKRPMQPLSPSPLAASSIEVDLPLQELPSVADLETVKSHTGVMGEWSQLLLMQPERIRPSVPLEITLLSIANGLSLLAMNAEIVVEYGLYIKRKFSKSMLPIAYTNGMIGYVPTAEQVLEGGYEAKESTFYFGLPAAFDPALKTEIYKGLLHLTRKEDQNEDRETD